MNPENVRQVLADHAACRMNDSRDGNYASAGDTAVDAWSCGLQLPFSEQLEDAEWAHLALAVACTVEAPVLDEITHHVDRLQEVVDRWDVPGGSRRLAQRARDKIAGLEVARRLIVGDAR